MDEQTAKNFGLTPEVLERLRAYRKNVMDYQNYFICNLYGEMKVGKTILMARMAKRLGVKLLIVSMDSGGSALKDWPELHEYVEIEEYKSPEQISFISKAIRYKADGYEEFGMVSIDPISLLSNNYVDHLRDNFRASGKSPRSTLESRPGINLPTIEIPGGEDYQAVAAYIRPIVANICAAEVHAAFITHEREPYHLEVAQARRSGEATPVRPDLPDKVYKTVGYYSQLIAHMSASGKDRYISCRQSPDHRAGARIKNLHGRIVSDNEFIEIIANWVQDKRD